MLNILLLLCGLSITLEPMYMGMYGNNIQVGNEVMYRSKFTVDSLGNLYKEYGMTYESINTIMSNKLSPRITLRQGNIRVQGWQFLTGGRTDGYLQTPPAKLLTNGYIFYYHFIQFWGHVFPYLPNVKELSGVAPIIYDASNDFEIITGNVHYIQPLNDKIDLLLGLNLGRIRNFRNEKFTVFELIYYLDIEPWLFVMENTITLESRTALTSSILRGPCTGLQFKFKLFDIDFDYQCMQSVLMGNVLHRGRWIDIDDIYYWLWNPETDEVDSLWHDVYEGNFYLKQRENVIIPVVESYLSTNYRLSNKVALKFGLFNSIWYNVPIAPEWYVPGAWTCINGTGWQFNRSTLVFTGISLGLQWRL